MGLFEAYVIPVGSAAGVILALRQLWIWLLGRPNLEFLEDLELETDASPGQVYPAFSEDQPPPERTIVTLVATNHGPAAAKECYLAMDQQYMEGNVGPHVGFSDPITFRRMEPRSTARFVRTVSFNRPETVHGICLNAWLIPKRGRAAGTKLYFQLGPEGLEFKHMVFRRVRFRDAIKAKFIARMPKALMNRLLKGRVPPFANLVRERRQRVRQTVLEDVHPATAKDRKAAEAERRAQQRARRKNQSS